MVYSKISTKRRIKMKRIISLILLITICSLSAFTLAGCQPEKDPSDDDPSVRTVIELDENNYWKYINVSHSANYDDEKASISYEISGVLDYALYEDVVVFFDVIYYTEGQPEEEHKSYTMRIACNAAGDAVFETTYLGITNVTVGKWLGVDGELVSFENYNWKIHVNSATGRVIYNI